MIFLNQSLKSFLYTCKKILDFKNRSSRMEYFYYYFTLFFISLIWMLLTFHNPPPFIINIALIFLKLVVWLSGISLNVRRLHDFNISGWWYLVYFITFFITYFYFFSLYKKNTNELAFFSYTIIIIQVMIFAFKKGTPGPNKYGNVPEY